MIKNLKNIIISIIILIGLINKSNAQKSQLMTSKELQKIFSSVIKEYEKLDSSGIVIITQKSNDSNTYQFSRLESQEMLLKNKPSSYFFVNKKLILYYGYSGLKENISFDSTMNDKELFKLLVAKSNKKLFDDFPKSKYLNVSTYNPTEWIVIMNKEGIGVHDREATMKIKSGNPRWKI